MRFSSTIRQTLFGLATFCAIHAIAQDARLVRVDIRQAGHTETQSPIYSGGDWTAVSGSSRIVNSLQRYSDGSLWKWSPNAPHHLAAVRVLRPDGAAGSGSCIRTIETRCVILTNHHVAPSGSVTIQWQGGQRSSGVVFASSSSLDVAAIYVASPPAGFATIPLSNRDPAIGQELEIVAFGGPQFGRKRSFLGKRVQNRYRPNDLEIAAASISGDSGSPVLWNGHLVGVQFGGYGVAGQEQQVDLVYPAVSHVSPRILNQWLGQAMGSCPGGSCTPVYSDPNVFYNPPQQQPIQPFTPSQPSAPIVPPTQPATPPPPAPSNPSVVMPVQPMDLDRMKAEIIAEIVAQIPDAKDGKPGPPGPRGPQGPTGEGVDPAAIAAAIDAYMRTRPQQNSVVNLEVSGDTLVATYADGSQSVLPMASGGPAFFEIVSRKGK